MQAPVFDGIARDEGASPRAVYPPSGRRRGTRRGGDSGTRGAGGRQAQARQAEQEEADPDPADDLPGREAGGGSGVPASGDTVKTPILEKGQRYTDCAPPAWNTNATDGNDAVAAFAFATPNAPVTVAGGGRGSPSTTAVPFLGQLHHPHLYEREVIGRGAALSLRTSIPLPRRRRSSSTSSAPEQLLSPQPLSAERDI